MKNIQLLNEFVLKSYNKIAEDFHKSRKNLFWKEFLYLKQYLKEDIKILDLGCGSGRMIKFLKSYIKNFEYIGIDFSEKLILIAKKEFPEYKFIKLDILKKQLPFENNYFDLVLLIAVLHHIPSKNHRILILKEVKRVLKQDGVLFMTNWNLLKFRTFIKYFLNLKRLKILKFKFFSKHLFIPWKNRYLRYYYAFSSKEIKKLCKKIKFKILLFKKNNNLTIVAKK